MILEVAILSIKPNQTIDFEKSFSEARKIIAAMHGFVSLDLQKCIENDHQYILLVRWETLEDHTRGFRESKEYQEWKKLLHHFYDPFPSVEHYMKVDF